MKFGSMEWRATQKTMMGMGMLREARQRRNVQSPKTIKDLAVQTDRQLPDWRDHDTELTSITLNAAGSQSLARFPLVHEVCIVPVSIVFPYANATIQLASSHLATALVSGAGYEAKESRCWLSFGT
jgi:hypothetical protein